MILRTKEQPHLRTDRTPSSLLFILPVPIYFSHPLPIPINLMCLSLTSYISLSDLLPSFPYTLSSPLTSHP